MEDDKKKLKMDNNQKIQNGKQPKKNQIKNQIEDDQKHRNGRRPKNSKRKTTKKFKMEDDQMEDNRKLKMEDDQKISKWNKQTKILPHYIP